MLSIDFFNVSRTAKAGGLVLSLHLMVLWLAFNAQQRPLTISASMVLSAVLVQPDQATSWVASRDAATASVAPAVAHDAAPVLVPVSVPRSLSSGVQSSTPFIAFVPALSPQHANEGVSVQQRADCPKNKSVTAQQKPVGEHSSATCGDEVGTE